MCIFDSNNELLKSLYQPLYEYKTTTTNLSLKTLGIILKLKYKELGFNEEQVDKLSKTTIDSINELLCSSENTLEKPQENTVK
jgi:hypothetical protein